LEEWLEEGRKGRSTSGKKDSRNCGLRTSGRPYEVKWVEAYEIGKRKKVEAQAPQR